MYIGIPASALKKYTCQCPVEIRMKLRIAVRYRIMNLGLSFEFRSRLIVSVVEQCFVHVQIAIF